MKYKKKRKHRMIQPLLLAMTLTTTALPSAMVPVHAASTKPITVLLDGKPMKLDTPPVLTKDGRVMVPFRAIYEALGAQVQYVSYDQQVRATLGKNRLRFWLKNPEAYSDLTLIDMLAAPVIVNDHSLVSVRFLAESLGADVTWDGATQTVQISSKPLQLVHAIEQGDVAGVKQYLADGNSPNVTVAGTSAVSYALSFHEVDAAKALLDAGGSFQDTYYDSVVAAPLDRLHFAYSPIVVKQLGSELKQRQPDEYDRMMTIGIGTDDLELTREFVSQGADLNGLNGGVKQPSNVYDLFAERMTTAVARDDQSMVDTLLTMGVDPEEVVEADPLYTGFRMKGTALQLAAMLNFPDLIPIEIKHGANVDAANDKGWTALMFAAEHGNTSALKALLQSDAKLNLVNSAGLTALDIATVHGNQDTIQLLTAAGAQHGTNGNPQLTDAIDDPTTLQTTANQGDLPKASEYGQTDVVKRLLATSDASAWMDALQRAIENVNTETARTILQSGVPAGEQGKGANWMLDQITSGGDVELVDTFLSDTQTEFSSVSWKLALNGGAFEATRLNDVPLLDVFFKHGYKPSGKAVETPLQEAASFGDTDALNYLLQNGDTPEVEPDALLDALLFGNVESAKTLLAAGADPNVTDASLTGDVETPLMLAIRLSDVDLVQDLILKGADVNAKTVDGTSILAMAQARQNQAVIQALQAAGAK